MALSSSKKRKMRASFSLTFIFIIVNVVISLSLIVLGISSLFLPSPLLGEIIPFIALNPKLVFETGSLWTLLTSMFVHLDLSHLAVNMISLFFIGSFVERIIGRRRYFWLYMISGLVAGLFFIGFAYLGSYFSWGAAAFGTIDSSAVGASGALFGLAGLLAVLMPRLPVLVFFILPMPMWAAMVLLLVGLWVFSVAVGLPVGNTAHFGGLVVGLAYGWYLRTKYSRKIVMLNRMFGQ